MSSKTNGVHVDWVRAPPPNRPLCVRICKAIYDSDEKTFLGRTAKRWGIVLAFYLVFYAVLAVLFGICMAALMYTLPADRPAYTLQESLIGSSPGVAFRPRGPLNTQVLQYSVDNTSHYQDYIKQLDDYLTPYKNLSWFPVTSECSAEENYGYPLNPCFFIKLNKIIDWIPEYYDDVSSLPADMPDDLKQHIESLNPPEKRQHIWVSCAEEFGNSTIVQYPWGRGLLAARFPRRHRDLAAPGGAMLPVKITAAVNTPVAIRCWTWARNVVRNKSLKDPAGYTRILLYIQDPTAEQSM